MTEPTYQTKIYDKQGGDELVVASGGKVTIESGGEVNGPNGASLIDSVLTLDIADGSADASYYLAAPFAGKIKKIWSAIDGAVGTADMTITPYINGAAVTGGVVTIATTSSAAGDVDSAVPSAANTVAAGDVIKLTVAGGGSGGSPRVHVAIVIER